MTDLIEITETEQKAIDLEWSLIKGFGGEKYNTIYIDETGKLYDKYDYEFCEVDLKEIVLRIADHSANSNNWRKYNYGADCYVSICIGNGNGNDAMCIDIDETFETAKEKIVTYLKSLQTQLFIK